MIKNIRTVSVRGLSVEENPVLTQAKGLVPLVFLIMICLGGYRERETPGSIPNPEAKPLIADNTRPFRAGNVGRCLVDHFLLRIYLLKNYSHTYLYASQCF